MSEPLSCWSKHGGGGDGGDGGDGDDEADSDDGPPHKMLIMCPSLC